MRSRRVEAWCNTKKDVFLQSRGSSIASLWAFSALCHVRYSLFSIYSPAITPTAPGRRSRNDETGIYILSWSFHFVASNVVGRGRMLGTCLSLQAASSRSTPYISSARRYCTALRRAMAIFWANSRFWRRDESLDCVLREFLSAHEILSPVSPSFTCYRVFPTHQLLGSHIHSPAGQGSSRPTSYTSSQSSANISTPPLSSIGL